MVDTLLFILSFLFIWFLVENLFALSRYVTFRNKLIESEIEFDVAIMLHMNIAYHDIKYHREEFNLEERVLGVAFVDTNPNDVTNINKRGSVKLGLVLFNIQITYDIFLVNKDEEKYLSQIKK